MSEGPEVHRIAAKLRGEFAGSSIVSVETRLKKAQAWLNEHPGEVEGREILGVSAAGKNLIWSLGGELYFHMHLLMFGKIKTYSLQHHVEFDRMTRGLIVSTARQAELVNVQVFNIGVGDPFQQIPTLCELGPDLCSSLFDRHLFIERLLREDNLEQEIGPVLLDQTVAAGVGNYLKSDILFECAIDPWARVGELTAEQVDCLARTIPAVGQRALKNSGQTVPDDVMLRITAEKGGATPGWSERHWVFRHTNRPCKVCGTPIKARRQGPGEGRMTFYCPNCQGVDTAGVPREASMRSAG
ncbi:MAG: DNA-formamidopyrimidine glycosylase family protein [Chloroflexia bacterium]